MKRIYFTPNSEPALNAHLSALEHPAADIANAYVRTGHSTALAHRVAHLFDGADDVLVALTKNDTNGTIGGHSALSSFDASPDGVIDDGVAGETGGAALPVCARLQVRSAKPAPCDNSQSTIACSLATAPHAPRDILINTAPYTGISQHVNVRCDECSGFGRITIGRPNDPSAELFVCEVCDGTGEAVCCECREPATVLHHVNCRPPLAMPLCAKHHAEYAEELV